MRSVTKAGMSVASAGVVLASLHASTQVGTVPGGSTAAAPAGVVVSSTPPAASALPTTPTTTPTTRASTSPTSPASARGASSTRPPAAVRQTVNGRAVDTPYGPVQVQISLRGSTIVRADALTYPSGSGRDQTINGYAVPLLNQATLDLQSTRIDTVSGATYTSQGYRQSLQSAIDAAHLR